MKKIIAIISSIVIISNLIVIILLTLDNAEDKKDSDNEVPQTKTTEVLSKQTVEYELPRALVGLVDEEIKPFGKAFYNFDGALYEFKIPIAEESKGELRATLDGSIWTIEWKYLGSGVYSIGFLYDVYVDYFICDGFLVAIEESYVNENRGLSGNSKIGFESYNKSGHKFYKDGRYEYHNGPDNITTVGSYVMVTDNIMELTREVKGDEYVEYYLIDNDHYLHEAFPLFDTQLQ